MRPLVARITAAVLIAAVLLLALAFALIQN
ncbi:hypothetical protein BH23PSE1_BH23PSE1_00950 [soil metagenome]